MQAAPKICHRALEAWIWGVRAWSGVPCVMLPTPSRTCHPATLSVSELGAKDVPEVGQDLSLGVRDEG